jgi:hypothetical protein
MADSPTDPPPHAAEALSDRSDRILALVLGPDLQGATLRLVLYLVIIGAVLATIGVLAR